MLDEIDFLRIEAVELRDLAGRELALGDLLRHIADELEARAADLRDKARGLTPEG